MNTRWWMVVACAVLLACGSDDDDDAAEEEGDVGKATGAVCDPTLTYAADVAPIANAYCTTCHATALKGAARHDAPDDHNFDSEQGMLAEKAHVDEAAGSGPDATGSLMPPAGYPQPTTAQRATLSSWLACH